MTIPVDPLAPPASPARGSSTGAMSLRINPKMLPGMALLVILLVGLVSSIYTLVFKHADLPAKDMTLPAAANGDATAAIANLLQHANPLEDPLVTVDPDLLPLDDVIARSDILILCTPHRVYKTANLRGKPVVDVWGFLDHANVIS